MAETCMECGGRIEEFKCKGFCVRCGQVAYTCSDSEVSGDFVE